MARIKDRFSMRYANSNVRLKNRAVKRLGRTDPPKG